jgi:hypothetical protein
MKIPEQLSCNTWLLKVARGLGPFRDLLILLSFDMRYIFDLNGYPLIEQVFKAVQQSELV